MFYDQDNDPYIYSNSDRKIRKDGYEDINSSSEKKKDYDSFLEKYQPSDYDVDNFKPDEFDEVEIPRKRSVNTKKSKKKKKHYILKAFSFVLCLLIAGGAFLYGYTYKTIDKIKRSPLDQSDLGITTDDYSGYINIALLGIDTRSNNDSGRSDAVVVVSIDKKNKKIRLISIARDSYVKIDGHSYDKLTHAYAYGKSQLAVKTINQNYGLEIKDYVTMNFFGLSSIIDYIGGVTVDVDKAEMDEMNSNIIPWMVEMGIPCEKITHTGNQLLSGGQAVSYARIRHTDSDIIRGNRQKEVLSAMFSKVKKMNPTKIPGFAEMFLKECKTSLKTKDILSLGIWAVFSSPEFENLSIPNDNIKSSGKIIKGVWYYYYDIDAAKKDIKDFIFSINAYSKENIAKKADSK